MTIKNKKILDEVKKHINSNLSNISENNQKKDLNITKNNSLDKVIEDELKKWINNNAPKIAKSIISSSVKKLFK